MKIALLIYSPAISGGTFVIYEYVKGLTKLGHEVSLITDFNVTKEWLSWYPEAKDFNFMSFAEAKDKEFDLVYATWWATVSRLSEIKSKKYAYFVQSFEPYFVSESQKPLMKYIESTYVRNLPVITEATWIKKLLEKNYNLPVLLVKNGIRKDIFRNKGLAFKEREKDTVRILIEGPVDVPFKNVPKTVKLCREAGVEEIWLLTSSDIDNYPGVDRVFSKLSIFDTPLVYRSCDILVKLSYVEGMFGPPLEMFHCGGTAIVYNVTGHDEYIRHKKNAFVVKRDNDTMVVKYLRKLKNDPTLLKQMKQEAIKTANEWYGWEDAVVEFEKATQHIFLNIPTPSRRDLLSKEKFFKSSYNIHQESLDLINKSKLLKIENNIRRVRRNVFDKIRSLSQDN